jgi:hypothetical protein
MGGYGDITSTRANQDVQQRSSFAVNVGAHSGLNLASMQTTW